MSGPAFEGTIEVVWGGLVAGRTERLLGFWAKHGALEGEPARRRLDQVVCLLLGADGEIAGANSVFREDVPLIAGRPLWIYRRFIAEPAPAGAEEALINAAYATLDAEYEIGAGDPAGLCVLVSDRAEIERSPEAIWPETELKYAGYLPDGAQVRIRYFLQGRI